MRSLSILSIVLITISLSLSSCLKDIFCVSGEGEIITKTLDLEEFTGINAVGSANVIITQGDTQYVEAKGHENILLQLETYVSGGTWKIKLDDEFCYTDYELTIYITVPDLEEISITGSSDVIVNDFVEQDDLEINITGSGDIDLNEFHGCEYVSIDINGSGDIEFKDAFNDLKDLEIDISGSGNIKAYNAPTDNCDVKISGSGDCRVHVYDKLNVRISGSGDVYYKGNPFINTDITGSGDVINAN